MRLRLLLALMALLEATQATAQTRVYVGATAGADSADRGSMALRTVPTAGGVVGWRLTPGWSIELHLDRGFKEGPPHGRIGFFGTDTLRDSARGGLGMFVVWKAWRAGRVTFAPTLGLSQRWFRTTRTIGVDRPVNLPPDDPLLQDDVGTTQVAGPSAGLLLSIELGRGWSIAPEVRGGLHFSSEGIYGDGVVAPISAGVRLMWGF